MSNLVDYAKDELKRIGMIDSGESYNDWATKAILDLIELFSSQGHSGFTASYVINAFNRLARFKPLSPLTGEADEWNDTGHGLLQNKRYSAVFKDEDGIAYNSEGRVFSDDGEIWYGCKDSRVNITFPYTVPDKPEYIYKNKETEDKTPKKPNCYHCDNYKNGYCDARGLRPCYPEEGCDYFETHVINIQEIYEKVKDLSERVETLEKNIIEEKEEEIKKLKAEIEMCHLQRKLNESYIRRKVRKEESEVKDDL